MPSYQLLDHHNLKVAFYELEPFNRSTVKSKLEQMAKMGLQSDPGPLWPEMTDIDKRMFYGIIPVGEVPSLVSYFINRLKTLTNKSRFFNLINLPVHKIILGLL